MKIITEEEVRRRIEEKFPGQPFEIIEYTRMSKPFTIKCLKCGNIKTYSNAVNFIGSSRKGVCFCYNENNAMTKHIKNKEKAQQIIKDKNYTFIEYGYKEDTRKHTITVKCGVCKQLITKPITEFCKCPDCYYCETKQKLNTEAFKALLPPEYELLSEYKNVDTRILLRHNCGFIWTITPHKFNRNYMGCPKCNRKRSKGERKVGQILDKMGIQYRIEESFEWQTNKKRRYDFYLPDYNMVIEYMGEQHYRDREIEVFKYDYQEQKRIDEEKYNDAINAGLKYLAIGYKEYNHIEEILLKTIGTTTNYVDTSVSKEQSSILE